MFTYTGGTSLSSIVHRKQFHSSYYIHGPKPEHTIASGIAGAYLLVESPLSQGQEGLDEVQTGPGEDVLGLVLRGVLGLLHVDPPHLVVREGELRAATQRLSQPAEVSAPVLPGSAGIHYHAVYL